MCQETTSEAHIFLLCTKSHCFNFRCARLRRARNRGAAFGFRLRLFHGLVRAPAQVLGSTPGVPLLLHHDPHRETRRDSRCHPHLRRVRLPTPSGRVFDLRSGSGRQVQETNRPFGSRQDSPPQSRVISPPTLYHHQ